MASSGPTEIRSLRAVARSHAIAWRKDMESRKLAPTSIRRKLSALFSLFYYLCEHNAVLGDPMDGVKRPASNNSEGSKPALDDAQVRRLLTLSPRAGDLRCCANGSRRSRCRSGR
jgi:site-specific recombinase XerD